MSTHVCKCMCMSACAAMPRASCRRAGTCSSSSSASAADDSTICSPPSGAAPAPEPAPAPALVSPSRACTSVAISTASSPSAADGSSAAATALRSAASSAFLFLFASRSWRTSATSSCDRNVRVSARWAIEVHACQCSPRAAGCPALASLGWTQSPQTAWDSSRSSLPAVIPWQRSRRAVTRGPPRHCP